MDPILQYILDYLEQQNPAHGARVRLRLEAEDSRQLARASAFFARYKSHIETAGRTLEYGLDCYLKLVARMVHERMEFLRSGKYASSSFAEVEKQIYSNPDVFEYHMHGLVFAQFFWPEQAARFRFFSEHIGAELAHAKNYLEIGGGHALYLLEASDQAPPDLKLTLLDISESSMKLARGIARGLPVEFRLMNIFEYVPDTRFDFITLGEVLEHVEDPRALLEVVRQLLAPGGHAFISSPANSPTIDHIYLFHSAEEIRTMLNECGFTVLREKIQFSENVSEEKARKLKVATMYAAFVQPDVR